MSPDIGNCPVVRAIFFDSNLFKKQNVVIRNLHFLLFVYSINISNNFEKSKMFAVGTTSLVLNKPKFVTLADAICSQTPRAFMVHR